MDKKLEEAMKSAGTQDIGLVEGFKLAIELLRKNKYHGHYAQQCANWLEEHFNKEVSSKTTIINRGY